MKPDPQSPSTSPASAVVQGSAVRSAFERQGPSLPPAMARVAGLFRENDQLAGDPEALVREYVAAYEAAAGRSPAPPAAAPFFVFGTGHSGSRWIALLCSLLNPDVMICSHEDMRRRVDWEGFMKEPARWEAWLAQLARAASLPPREAAASLLPQWVADMDRRLEQFPLGGYSESGVETGFFQLVHHALRRYERAKGVLLVRNGILVVNSLTKYHQDDPLREGFLTGEVFKDVHLARRRGQFEQLAGRFPGQRFFIARCITWDVVNRVVRDGWASLDGRFMLCRLEDLSSSAAAIAALNRFLGNAGGDERLMHAAGAIALALDSNRKLEANNDPRAVWSRWTPDQRAIFQQVCGEAMGDLGYPAPAAP